MTAGLLQEPLHSFPILNNFFLLLANRFQMLLLLLLHLLLKIQAITNRHCFSKLVLGRSTNYLDRLLADLWCVECLAFGKLLQVIDRAICGHLLFHFFDSLVVILSYFLMLFSLGPVPILQSLDVFAHPSGSTPWIWWVAIFQFKVVVDVEYLTLFCQGIPWAIGTVFFPY